MAASTYKTLAGAGAALALSFGIAAQAAPVPQFTVDPSALGGSRDAFNASFMAGTSSSLLTLHADTNTVAGAGWINFSAFENNGSPLSPGKTGLGVDYSLWVTYNYTTALSKGSFGTPGSDYVVTSLTYTLWGAEGDLSEAFIPANAATGTAATAPMAFGINLGGGSLLEGTAAFTASGGAAFNTLATYQNTAEGDGFFIDPRPFYNLAFNEFNNTAQGLQRNGNLISIVSASGGVDFNSGTVPEPVSLALFGLGLVGIGAATRRRKV